MTYLVVLLLICLVLGLVGIASNPSPYFAALGLVIVAGVGCGLIISHGSSFLSLVLFLIYLGGMLVVFAYSAALASEPYPESWGDLSVAVYGVVYLVGVVVLGLNFYGGWFEYSCISGDEFSEKSNFRGDTVGVALMYSFGGWMLIISAWMLLLALFAVLELTRGLARGTLRVI